MQRFESCRPSQQIGVLAEVFRLTRSKREYGALATCPVVSVSRTRQRSRGSRRLSLSAIFGVSFSGNGAHEEGPEYGTSASSKSRTTETTCAEPDEYGGDAEIITYRDAVIAGAARHRLPAVYPFRLYVAAGPTRSRCSGRRLRMSTTSYACANPACIERPPASASGLHTLRSLYH